MHWCWLCFVSSHIIQQYVALLWLDLINCIDLMCLLTPVYSGRMFNFVAKRKGLIICCALVAAPPCGVLLHNLSTLPGCLVCSVGCLLSVAASFILNRANTTVYILYKPDMVHKDIAILS